MVTIRASGGKDVSMSRSELLYDYDIRWAEGSGTEVARREQEDKVLQLFQLGLVDAQYAIGALDLKGKEDLIQRQNAREMMQMKMDFEVRMEQAKSGGAKPGGAANGNGNGNGKPKNRMQEAA
jgi:anti-sigma-K factor RskA